MANANVYSGKEFSVYLSHDDATGKVGTFNATSTSQWKQVDIESFSFPDYNPVQEFEMRTGRGRIAETSNVYTSDEGVVRSIELGGRLTEESLEILLSSLTGIARVSNEITIPFNHSPSTLATGSTAITAGEYHHTLSLYVDSPIATENIRMNGLVCTSLSITADMGTASGRFNYTATLETGFKPTTGEISSFAPSTASTDFYLLKDITTKTISANNSSFADINPLIDSFGLNFTSSAKFLGRGTTPLAGDPEVIGRSLPELEMTYDMKVKYDSDTAVLVDEYRSTSQNIGVTLLSTDGLDVDISESKLSNVSFDTGDVASLSISGKILAPTSGSALIIDLA